jgi:uncharacterized protein (DUF849 family)
MLKACLNGARHAGEHPALPATPAAIAHAAAGAVAAGADALHVHPKDDQGADTLDPVVVAAVLNAVREATPGTPVGITTGAWALPDPRQRLAVIGGWTVLPDFASVNWHEPGAQSVAAALLDRGVGVEAGLWHAAAIASWRSWNQRDRCLRVLLEVVQDHPPVQAVAVAGQLVAALGDVTGNTSVLLHGEGASTWPVFKEAVRRGLDVRIGLEDVLVLPNGSTAESNAELVAAARGLISSYAATPHPQATPGARDPGANTGGSESLLGGADG